MSKKTINVGLLGFGTIGAGVVKVLQENAEVITERLGVPVRLRRIADKDITTPRAVTPHKDVILTTDAAHSKWDATLYL